MTTAEVQQLRTAARTWEATPVTANKPVRREIADSNDVMLGTGVRIGELLAIRWDDVDLEATDPADDLSHGHCHSGCEWWWDAVPAGSEIEDLEKNPVSADYRRRNIAATV